MHIVGLNERRAGERARVYNLFPWNECQRNLCLRCRAADTNVFDSPSPSLLFHTHTRTGLAQSGTRTSECFSIQRCCSSHAALCAPVRCSDAIAFSRKFQPVFPCSRITHASVVVGSNRLGSRFFCANSLWQCIWVTATLNENAF